MESKGHISSPHNEQLKGLAAGGGRALGRRQKNFTEKDGTNQVEVGGEVPEPVGRLFVQETHRWGGWG